MKWTYNFIQRHDELKTQFTRAVRLANPPVRGSDLSTNFISDTPCTEEDVRVQVSSIRQLAKEQSRRLGDVITQIERAESLRKLVRDQYWCLDDAIDQIERDFQIEKAGSVQKLAREQSRRLDDAFEQLKRGCQMNITEESVPVGEAISLLDGDGEIEEESHVERISSDANPINERCTPRCNLCEMSGLKRNRSPEMSG